MSKTLLIIGDCCDDKWIGGFLRNCAFHKGQADVYCANTNYSTNYFTGFDEICKDIYNVKKHCPLFLYKIPIIRRLLYFLDIKLLFRPLFHSSKFDIINIHYVLPELCSVNFKKHTKCLVITPWGSDVLRRSWLELLLLKKVFDSCDYITVPQPRFRDEIKLKLGQPDSKFLSFGMGTDVVDYLIENQNYKKNQAKEDLGLRDKFIVVCGYNAHPEQNHIQIIDALSKIKKELPDNTILLFPMTYGAPQAYKNTVNEYVKNKGFECVFFEKFLEKEELLAIRKGADVFIHAQKTDNNSGSLAEHLLCGTKVVNAAWLKYPQYESLGTPYYVFNSFEELPEVVLKAIHNTESLISPAIVECIKGISWSFMSKQWQDFVGNVE